MKSEALEVKIDGQNKKVNVAQNELILTLNEIKGNGNIEQ
jgi:hypothetical protein